ncbi:MAG: hypothetical protein V7K48_16420 [Nostoc sp.]
MNYVIASPQLKKRHFHLFVAIAFTYYLDSAEDLRRNAIASLPSIT